MLSQRYSQDMDIQEENTLTLLRKKLSSGVFLFRVFLFILLFFSFYLCYLIATPFFHVIVLSIVVSGITYPLYVKILAHVKHSYIASLCVVSLIFLCIVLPISILFALLIPEVLRFITLVQNYIQTTPNIIPPGMESAVRSFLYSYAPFIDIDEIQIKSNILSFSKTLGQVILSTTTTMIKTTVYFFFQFFLFILIVFFLLRDGERMFVRVRDLLPLHTSSFERITTSLRRVSKAVFVGGLLVALAQAIAATIGFFIIGYPSLLGGFATGIASLIPVVGTGLVWLPFGSYLLLMGETKEALIFLAWNIVVVTNIDSFLRPYFMSGNVSASVLFIFLSILGGVNIFGILGIFYGPLILAFALVMLDIYNEEYQIILKQKDSIQ